MNKEEMKRLSILEEILINPDIKYCYIRKGIYYMPDWCGYTSFVADAGVYKKEDAVEHAKFVKEITLEPVDIEEHNEMINEKIENLKSRLL